MAEALRRPGLRVTEVELLDHDEMLGVSSRLGRGARDRLVGLRPVRLTVGSGTQCNGSG